MEEIKKGFKAGFVAVAGRPNVGKSTLVNALLHQKVAAVSPRPQTTRRNQLGILTNKESQIIFVDTPGLHTPRHKLGEFMNQEAFEAVVDADLVLWLLDCNVPFTDEDKAIGERLKAAPKLPPVVILLTKIDLVKSSDQPALAAKALELFPAESIL
ncbi:MAG: GTPase Era, partial [Anaerolineaceae bacterium]|nr:GTPase Era [Anaerolineaceae bacterium]